ncbi:MAG: TolC family protein [Bacteroidetes bacterium]|nr:TolC family protein [Bacteroidota bacterium]MCL2302801.1 TolC family protein [Lentimicrobiaceae bacterium]
MSLQACIDFALEHSYTVKQKILEKELRYVQLQATKTSIAPTLGANIGQNLDFGRSALADALIINTTQATTNFYAGLNMDLFQGLRTHHQMKSDKLNLEATLFDIESAKENIELTVTAYYLQILLNKEILEVYKTQVISSQEQVDRIQLLVNNGKSSDAELYAAKATLATDQVAVVEANNAVRLSTLDLAQLMNYPDVSNFGIATEADDVGIDEILNKNVDVYHVVENALQNRPAIKAALTRIEQAKRTIKVYQSGWYPTLGFSASFGTGYFYRFKEISGFPNQPFGEQFRNNARQSLGLSLYIPIFDKLSTHYNVKQQRINVKAQELQLEETRRILIKEIEQAYVNAVASKEKYLASQVANTSSAIAFQYEEVKFNAGSSTNFEFNDARNKYLQAQSNLIQAKFDFLFRIKILEFYGKN